jgi:hypothetical protein
MGRPRLLNDEAGVGTALSPFKNRVMVLLPLHGRALKYVSQLAADKPFFYYRSGVEYSAVDEEILIKKGSVCVKNKVSKHLSDIQGEQCEKPKSR